MRAFVFLMALGLSLPLVAEDTPHEFFQKIWSPYCPGNSLLECPSSKAERLREEIQSRLEQGEAESSIIKDLEGRYGQTIYMEPGKGRGNLAYLLPWLMFFAVIGGLILFIRNYRKKKAAAFEENTPAPAKPAPTTPAADSHIQAKIMEDLQDRLS